MASMVKVVEATSTPTITAGAYSAGDVVGGRLSFNLQAASGVWLLKSVRIADDDNEKAACKLYLFNSAPTSIADNAAFAPAIADLQALVAIVTIASADFSTINGNAVALKESLASVFTVPGGVLYGYLVCDATPTYAATTDLAITLLLMSEGA